MSYLTAGALVILCTYCNAICAEQTAESQLKPGESQEQVVSLEAGQSTILRITKTNADLQVVIKSGGETVRELVA